MPRSSTRGAQWQRPSDQELGVLKNQIDKAINDGEKLISAPYADDGRWGGRETNLSDLIERAFGPGRWVDEFHGAGNQFGIGIIDPEYMSQEEIDLQRRELRGEKIHAPSGVAPAANRASDTEAGRRR